MTSEEEYHICENEMLQAYHFIKEHLSEGDKVVCQHLGTFSQHLLISIISTIEHALTEDGVSVKLKKRLLYLIIECIQNIIYHSEKLPDNNQLAYLIVIRNDQGYTFYASNIMETKLAPSLETKLDDLLSVDEGMLAKIFAKKLKDPKINEQGHGGIGLLTMISKSGNEFTYTVKKVSENISVFQIKINTLLKNY